MHLFPITLKYADTVSKCMLHCRLASLSVVLNVVLLNAAISLEILQE